MRRCERRIQVTRSTGRPLRARRARVVRTASRIRARSRVSTSTATRPSTVTARFSRNRAARRRSRAACPSSAASRRSWTSRQGCHWRPFSCRPGSVHPRLAPDHASSGTTHGRSGGRSSTCPISVRTPEFGISSVAPEPPGWSDARGNVTVRHRQSGSERMGQGRNSWQSVSRKHSTLARRGRLNDDFMPDPV